MRDETHISAQQYQEEAYTWIQEEDEYKGGQNGTQEEAGQRPPQTDSVVSGPGRMAQEQNGRQTLRPCERLGKKSEFKECFRSGRRIRIPGLLIIMRPNNLPYRRIGLSVGRRFGKAVIRNRAKRIIRELFRRNKEKLPEGHDFVFIPQEDFLKIKWKEHVRHLRDAFSSS